MGQFTHVIAYVYFPFFFTELWKLLILVISCPIRCTLLMESILFVMWVLPNHSQWTVHLRTLLQMKIKPVALKFLSSMQIHPIWGNDHSFLFRLTYGLLTLNYTASSSGLSCPPTDFVEDSFLLLVRDFLSEGGIFIVNLVSRSEAIKEKVILRLKAVSSNCTFMFLHHPSNGVCSLT